MQPKAPLSLARVQLHHAVQLVAAVGRELGPPQADDGHTSLSWEGGAFVGPTVAGATPWRAALRVEPLGLELIEGGRTAARQPLSGLPRAAARAWLAARASERGAPAKLSFDVPYELPPHDVVTGAPFAIADAAGLAELGAWFALGDTLLREVATAWPAAAPVRLWPHHFDVGSVLPLGTGDGEEAASIGIGLSPGDEGIDLPYFYVTPWPPPTAAESLPPLAAPGTWHRQGWTGAVLTAGALGAAGGPEARPRVGRAFLANAVAVLKAWQAARPR